MLKGPGEGGENSDFSQISFSGEQRSPANLITAGMQPSNKQPPWRDWQFAGGTSHTNPVSPTSSSYIAKETSSASLRPPLHGLGFDKETISMNLFPSSHSPCWVQGIPHDSQLPAPSGQYLPGGTLSRHHEPQRSVVSMSHRSAVFPYPGRITSWGTSSMRRKPQRSGQYLPGGFPLMRHVLPSPAQLSAGATLCTSPISPQSARFITGETSTKGRTPPQPGQHLPRRILPREHATPQGDKHLPAGNSSRGYIPGQGGLYFSEGRPSMNQLASRHNFDGSREQGSFLRSVPIPLWDSPAGGHKVATGFASGTGISRIQFKAVRHQLHYCPAPTVMIPRRTPHASSTLDQVTSAQCTASTLAAQVRKQS